MDEDLKKVDEEIQVVLKKYNCALTVNHVISINKLKPTDTVPVEVVTPEVVEEGVMSPLQAI